MITVNKMLFPTDFSDCARHAFPLAAELARIHHAELHILHVIDLRQDGLLDAVYHSNDPGDIRGLLESAAQQTMDDELAHHSIEDLKIRQICQLGNKPGREIVDRAAAGEFDLIVLGTHGRGGLKRFFLGSVAEQVVRRARCPVITVRKRCRQQPGLAWRRILVPVDFSDHSRRALMHAKSIAASTGGNIALLHVMEPDTHPAHYYATPGLVQRIDIHHQDHTAKSLRRFWEKSGGPDVKAEVYALPGRTARTIVDFASDQQSDLIVLASHGRTGLKRLLLGSVAEKVVRRAPCPVFTVKAFGKSLLAGGVNRNLQAAAYP